MEGDNFVGKEILGHWSEELSVEEVVGGGVDKKEEVEGKVEAKKVVDWIEKKKKVEKTIGWVEDCDEEDVKVG